MARMIPGPGQPFLSGFGNASNKPSRIALLWCFSFIFVNTFVIPLDAIAQFNATKLNHHSALTVSASAVFCGSSLALFAIPAHRPTLLPLH